MKIVFLDRKTLGDDIDLERFENFGEVIIYSNTAHNEIQERVEDADIVITNKVPITKDNMKNSKIKLICIAATGMDKIDLKYANEAGIIVKNVESYSTASVSQVTISLVLHFVQKLNYYIEYVNSKKWEKSDIFTNSDELFHELENKNWGIIGLGEIGKRVAKIAEAFGANVNYYSTSGKNNNSQYTQLDLDELLITSDIITIHAPLNNTTYNLLNKTNLNLIKDGGILINVGRGGIINEEDLANLLNSNKELYCGLDVLKEEPMKADNPLNRVKNKERLIITPHIAWSSIEARNRLINVILDNVKKFVV